MARKTLKPPTISLPLIFLIISLSRFHVSEASGFSVDLIHRDSLHSSSFNSSLTTSERLRNALQRSFGRVRYYSLESVSTDIIPDKGAYVMEISLGTPPSLTTAIADTGSDLIWVQCKPCLSCFKQDAPLFDPGRSSSYKPVTCDSDTCNSLRRTSCEGTKGTCSYEVRYGDRSFSKGDVATETISLGSEASFRNVIMGCGHNDQGTFGSGTSGIVGLGGGKESLISQLSDTIQGKFSYCLVPLLSETEKSSGKMNFGDNAVVSGAGVVSTPIVTRTPQTFYYLTLEGVTVGNQRLDSVSSSSDRSNAFGDYEEGNIIIDSGTTLTFLPADLYSQVEEAVRAQVKLRETTDPQGLLNLCFSPDGNTAGLPEMTAHFKGGDVKLKAVNTFVRTSEESLCLAFAPANEIAIYGNLAQANFLVGYDLNKKTVSFKPTNCGGDGKE